MPVPPIPASKILYRSPVLNFHLPKLSPFLTSGCSMLTTGFETRLPFTVINEGQNPFKQSYE